MGQVRQGETEAWNRLTRLYGPLVYRWARQQGLQDADAADIVQEVFRVVAGRIADFRSEGPGATFRGWLRTITRRKLGDHFRRRTSRPPAIGGTDGQVLLQQVPDLPVDESSLPPSLDDEASLLHRALLILGSEFEERTWQAFWRATIDGQAAGEIARDLGMTPRAVRQAKYRVLRRLRTELGT